MSIGHPTRLSAAEAAAVLGLPVEAVTALADAGYLPTADGARGRDPWFTLGDLKGFLARHHPTADEGDLDAGDLDPETLLGALAERVDEMARRAFDVFTQSVPEAAGWPMRRQARFIEQARDRFEAILAVTGQGEAVDAELVGELERIGAAAAWSGSPLPELLTVLRISRDLVVQTAVEVAEERGRRWGLSLSLLLTRVLPAMDRLTDAVAQGYWSATIAHHEAVRARYQHVVDHSSDGVCEIDVDGRILYANDSLGTIVGVPAERLLGRKVTEVVSAEQLRRLGVTDADPTSPPVHEQLTLRRPDGVERSVEVRVMARFSEGQVVGYSAVVWDVTAQRELEAQRNEFLALVTSELRQPLTTILGLGATLEAHAADIPPARVARLGSSIRSHAERLARLADDLHELSQLERGELMVIPRVVRVAEVVQAAVDMVPDAFAVEIDVDGDLLARADQRRLEQVLANLVENGLIHGDIPVIVTARDRGDQVVITVRDNGPGVPDALVPTLFNRLHHLSGGRGRRGTGLGLSLARGLLEAMGGSITYEAAPGGGACFVVRLPAARRSFPAL